MKALITACTTLALASALSTATASPKYSGPITLTKETTIRATISGVAPGAITESLYVVAGDFNGDGIADAGTLRVACRDHGVAFASFLPRDVSVRDPGATARSSEPVFKGSTGGIPLARSSALVFTVQRPPSEGKTMSADSWHNASVTEGAATVCP